MAFEVYERIFNHGVFISISKGFLIFISAQAMRTACFKHGLTVNLLWDEDRGMLGIKATDPDDPNGLPIRDPNNRGSGIGSISGRGFLLKMAGIKAIQQAIRYEAEFKDGILQAVIGAPSDSSTIVACNSSTGSAA